MENEFSKRLHSDPSCSSSASTFDFLLERNKEKDSWLKSSHAYLRTCRLGHLFCKHSQDWLRYKILVSDTQGTPEWIHSVLSFRLDGADIQAGNCSFESSNWKTSSTGNWSEVISSSSLLLLRSILRCFTDLAQSCRILLHSEWETRQWIRREVRFWRRWGRPFGRLRWVGTQRIWRYPSFIEVPLSSLTWVLPVSCLHLKSTAFVSSGSSQRAKLSISSIDEPVMLKMSRVFEDGRGAL